VTTNGAPAGDRESTRVKICGLRRVADAELCLDLGASYLGCVLAADSPRCATIAEVQDIARAAANRAEVVLVFRGNSVLEILRLCDETSVRRVQIHGTNPLACQYLNFYGMHVHPVFAVPAGATCLPELIPPPDERSPALLDVGAGGTGRRFAWQLLGPQSPAATLVAGGITCDNVVELLEYRPFGIDVSSGVEQTPGVKDETLLRQLFERVGQPENPKEVRS